jgi:hypothetical protein
MVFMSEFPQNSLKSYIGRNRRSSSGEEDDDRRTMFARYPRCGQKQLVCADIDELCFRDGFPRVCTSDDHGDGLFETVKDCRLLIKFIESR